MEAITNYLSENWMNIIRWILDSGILTWAAFSIAKWKKTKNEIKESVKKAVDDNVPAMTQSAITTALSSAIQPLFAQLMQNSADQSDAMSAMVKCLALMQQNTPESKVAVIDVLSNLKICNDNKVNEDVKAFILETTEKLKKEVEDAINSLNAVSEKNQKIIEEAKNEEETEKEVVNTYDGTSI